MSKFTLTEYTILSAVFLQIQNLEAEVQYFDIEPDILLDTPGELFLLNIDQDSSNDFRFTHNKGVYFTEWDYEPRYFDAIFAGALNDKNWLAGSYFTVGSAASSSFVTYQPYQIPFGYPIGVMLSFQDDYSQLAAASIWSSLGELVNTEGNWQTGAEGFFGIRIERDDHYYYGWVRVTLADSAKSLTIHDYAYETIADKSIITGDSLGTMSVSTPSVQLINITCNGTTLFIHLFEPFNAVHCELNIYDLSGKRVFSKQLSGGDQSIIVPLQTGMYIATCMNGDEKVSQMITII